MLYPSAHGPLNHHTRFLALHTIVCLLAPQRSRLRGLPRSPLPGPLSLRGSVGRDRVQVGPHQPREDHTTGLALWHAGGSRGAGRHHAGDGSTGGRGGSRWVRARLERGWGEVKKGEQGWAESESGIRVFSYSLSLYQMVPCLGQFNYRLIFGRPH